MAIINDVYDFGPKYEGFISGDDVRWDDLRFPSQGINAPGAAGDPDIEATTGLWLFADNLTETLAGVAQMPHSWLEESTIVPHVHWQKTNGTSPTGVVLWQFDYEIVNNGDVAAMNYPNQLQSTTVADGTPDDGTANRVLISTFGNVSMRDKKISTLIFWKLSRIGGDVADTQTGDARLIEFDIHYMVDGRGSQLPFSKQDWGK